MTVCCAAVIEIRGALPYAVIVHGRMWGLFRTQLGAMLYMAEALGVSRRERLALLRQMEVGER